MVERLHDKTSNNIKIYLKANAVKFKNLEKVHGIIAVKTNKFRYNSLLRSTYCQDLIDFLVSMVVVSLLVKNISTWYWLDNGVCVCVEIDI